MTFRNSFLALALLGAAVACSSPEATVETTDSPTHDATASSAVDTTPAHTPVATPTRELPEVAPPILLAGTAYERAQTAECIDATPENWDDLHNVIHLSPSIISGSEPASEAALERISKMGVKTILSTDGKAPDAQTAAKYGMRYVHVPIQYSGITDDELAKIAKTFRELEGPFFVHCFHGKHRGPAGAAVGRLVLDGASREETLAQMAQCGTSKNYEGLYAVIATGDVPSAQETAVYEFDFPSAARFEGTRDAMIQMARHWDNLVLLGKRGWTADPAHPDLDPRNETQKLHQLFTQLVGDPEFKTEPEDYRGWMADGEQQMRRLVSAVATFSGSGDAGARKTADEALAATKQSCSACHGVYRNN